MKQIFWSFHCRHQLGFHAFALHRGVARVRGWLLGPLRRLRHVPLKAASSEAPPMTTQTNKRSEGAEESSGRRHEGEVENGREEEGDGEGEESREDFVKRSGELEDIVPGENFGLLCKDVKSSMI